MNLFDGPVPISQAVKTLQAKNLLPTSMTSAEIKQLAQALRNQSLFSAQTLNTDLLQKYKDVLQSILKPEEMDGVTKGLNPTKARELIQDFFKSIGYQPDAGTAGSLLDLSSFKRINLVIKTNSELAWGAGQAIAQNADPDVVDLWPGLELFRLEERKVPRDWVKRFLAAAAEVGDQAAIDCYNATGRLIALKDSEIWQALGDGAGGYEEDALGNWFPPFAFGSGMWTRDVSRKDMEDFGFLAPGQQAYPAPFDLSQLFGLPKAA